MSVAYSFVADWNFYRVAFGPIRQARRGRRLWAVSISTSIAAFLLLAWIYGRYTDASWTPAAAGGLIGGAIGGAGTYGLSKILLPIRIKRAPGYGATVAVVLDDTGFHAAEPQAKATLAWAAFTRVVRFSDGIVFMRGKIGRWLPNSALQNTDADAALAFLRSKVEVLDPG